jgi:hypothetical protein
MWRVITRARRRKSPPNAPSRRQRSRKFTGQNNIEKLVITIVAYRYPDDFCGRIRPLKKPDPVSKIEMTFFLS